MKSERAYEADNQRDSGFWATKSPPGIVLRQRNAYRRIQTETPDLDEQSWSDWVERGKLHDRALARRWRIIAGIVIPLIVVSGALYAFLRQT
jgi:hypothetical protein